MVTIKEVSNKKELKAFVKFPNILYKDNEFYVPQMVSMDLDTFTPGKNRAFEDCTGKFWLALDESGKVVGRVAGIINSKYNNKVGQKICRFGWIDFIESQEVATALLKTVEGWASANGAEAVEGPVGFLEFDISGVLVEGFDQIPTAYGKYNASYYEPLILREGYSKSTDFVEFRITVPDNFDRFRHFADIVAQRQGLHEVRVRSKRELVAKYASGIFRVMNECYSPLHGFSELSEEQCEDLKKQFLGNLRLDYVSVIADKEENVVGFGICLPSLSKALQKAKGRLFPFGFIHILRALRRNDTVDALLIAISNAYRDKGVNAMIATKIGDGLLKNGIRWIESTRELEDNVNVQNIWGRTERVLHKRARVYIKKLS